jgi:serine/threonine-protein kinase
VTVYQLKKVLLGKSSDLIIGPYVVEDKLGSGGMGKVYRARSVEDGRTVALKVVRPALVQNRTVRGRFEREVQAARALKHPNIVGILDAGEANGKVYLAMEFVDGMDLARLMRDSGMVAVEEACEYVRQAAIALQHAHDCGFVHRDVKPGNLVVAGERHVPQRTEEAVVKLLDLGLARAIDSEDMVAPDLTRDHSVVGTPDYMAPEQARSSRDVDTRADLYSLGCTLYFLLTGRVPFPYPSAIEKILAHQAEPPPPLQALRPEVPAALAGIVVRLMAKRPDDRFQTAAELAAALAPHAEYPFGAPPVEIGVKRDPGPGGTDDDAAQSPVPPSTNNSLAKYSALGLALGNPPPPPPEARAQPVAPSDNTPRPRGFTPQPPADAPTVGAGPTASEAGAVEAAGAFEKVGQLEQVEPVEPVEGVEPFDVAELAPPRPQRARYTPAGVVPWFVWGGLMLLVLTNIVVLVWLVTKQ